MAEFFLTPEEKAALPIVESLCSLLAKHPTDFANRVSMEYCARWIGEIRSHQGLPVKDAAPSPLRLGDVTVEQLIESLMIVGTEELRAVDSGGGPARVPGRNAAGNTLHAIECALRRLLPQESTDG